MGYFRAAGMGLLAVTLAPAGFGASTELSPDQAQVLDAARGYALGYAEKLPNFICTQITTRTSMSEQFTPTIQSRGRNPASIPLPIPTEGNDRIVEQLTFFNQQENYQVVSINGRPAPGVDHLQLNGAISVGEFGSALRDVFSPSSGAQFGWHGIENLRGHHAYSFDFRVPKENGIEIRDEGTGADVLVGYAGLIFVDPDTRQVMRMTSSLELPPRLSITAANRSIDYGFVTIADKQYTLPVHSEVTLQNSQLRYTNKIEFKDYRKFGAESTIHYGDETTPQSR